MLKKIITVCALPVLIQAAQNRSENKTSVFDVVTEIKPLQAIILGYLDFHDHLHATVDEGQYIEIYGVAYSPDGKHMATVTDGGYIMVRDAHTNQIVKIFKAFGSANAPIVPPLSIRSLAYTPQNYLICTQQHTNLETKIWDASDSYKLLENRAGVSQILYNKQGVCVEIRGSKVRWHANTKLVEHELDYSIVDAAISADQRYVIVSDYVVIKAFDLSAGQTKVARYLNVGYFALSPDDKYIAIPAAFRTLNLWDIEKLKFCRNIVGLPDTAREVVIFSPDGRYLIYAIDEKILYFYDLIQEKTVEVQVEVHLAQYIHYKNSLCYSPDGKYLAVAMGNKVQILTNQAREIVLDDEKNSQK